MFVSSKGGSFEDTYNGIGNSATFSIKTSGKVTIDGCVFHHNDAVVTRFGSGCSTVVSMTIAENARQGHQCFLGMLDPSVRPWVGANELSFTVPMSRFTVMMKTMRQCFLFDAPAWQRLKTRM